MYSFLPPPQHFCVPLDTEARCHAAQHLIRPWEVAHLVVTVPAYAAPVHFASKLGSVFGEWFARGDLAYIDDPLLCDRWSSPASTLRRGGGDCDDLAILGVSILLQAEVNAHFVVGRLCNRHECGGHAWVEGHDRGGWFLLEATSGAVYRNRRPAHYNPEMFVRPGSCRAA